MKLQDTKQIIELLKRVQITKEAIDTICNTKYGLPDAAEVGRDKVLRVGCGGNTVAMYRGCNNRAGFSKSTGIAIKGLLVSDLKGQLTQLFTELKALGVEVDE